MDGFFLPRLRVLHTMRAPLGGLFRHVRDVVQGQAEAGYDVGVVCERNASDPLSEGRLDELADHCSLGVHRISMSRHAGVGDVHAVRALREVTERLLPDVVHGHGAKGGAYARLMPKAKGRVRLYTPHGGSLHFSPRSPAGLLYHSVERFLLRRTEGIIFESQFGQDRFSQIIGKMPEQVRVIHNGITASEFDSLETSATAADFVFLGELRTLKGVGELLEALSILKLSKPVTAVLVGSGPDAEMFKAQARSLGLEDCVRFEAPMPARAAFALGRCVVMPSHHESLPYVVLEAAGASRPLITTDVGGIGEIFGTLSSRLIEPKSVAALSRAMTAFLDAPDGYHVVAAELRRQMLSGFSAHHMVTQINRFYSELLEELDREAAGNVTNGGLGKAGSA
ncbi:MAG: glycosyltransferase [Parvibaculaceae bacterium]|jgi:glycosyltransferase involved in cell wall biosynthesis|nr:glycosyltransferase [Parvibaculaceae bacterium]